LGFSNIGKKYYATGGGRQLVLFIIFVFTRR